MFYIKYHHLHVQIHVVQIKLQTPLEIHLVIIRKMKTMMKSLKHTQKYGEKLLFRNLGNPKSCLKRRKFFRKAKFIVLSLIHFLQYSNNKEKQLVTQILQQ